MKRNANKKISRLYRDFSITQKIYLPNLLIIILLISFVIIAATKVSTDQLISQITKSTKLSTDIIVQSMDARLNNIEEAATLVARNETVQTVLKKLQDVEPEEGTDHYFLMRSILQEIIYLRNYIYGATIYTSEGVRVGSQGISDPSYTSSPLLNDDLIEISLMNKGNSVWLDPSVFSYSGKNLGIVGITMLRAIRNGPDGPLLGFLLISVSEAIFTSLYSQLDYGPMGQYLILNNNGNVVLSMRTYGNEFMEAVNKAFLEKDREVAESSKVYSTPNGEMLIISRDFSRLGWLILGVLPLREFLTIGQSLTPLLYMTGLIGIILELLFAILMTRTISKPIIRLSKSMREAAENNFSELLEPQGNDEIGELTESFNFMLTQTTSLMDQIHYQHERERELELLALQSQIKPHFLYNTLESIASLIQMGSDEDAFNLTKSVSLFFKGVLSDGKPIITIREEVEILKHYLVIQKVRYQEKLSYEIAIDEDILDQRIIKLTLQPLVENSIYHGLKASHHNGMIAITGWKEDGFVRLRVKDNGVGIHPDRLQELTYEDGSVKMHSIGFGLSSVDQRIKQYYGKSYGIKISTVHGEMTQVDVRVPVEEDPKWILQ